MGPSLLAKSTVPRLKIVEDLASLLPEPNFICQCFHVFILILLIERGGKIDREDGDTCQNLEEK